MAPNGEGMCERRKPNKGESNYWKEASVIQEGAQCKGCGYLRVIERGSVIEGAQLMLREDPPYIFY